MTNEICGSFQTKEEAARAVNILSLKGISTHKIKIFTSQRHPKELAKEMDGSIVYVRDHVSKRPTPTFQRFFSSISECGEDIHNRLCKEGLSEGQAEKYSKSILSGSILIIADMKLKMGHERTIEAFSMQDPFVGHAKV